MKKVIVMAVTGIVLMLAANAFAVPRLETFVIGSAFLTIDREVSNPEISSNIDLNTTVAGYWQVTGNRASLAQGRNHGDGHDYDDIRGHVNHGPGPNRPNRPRPHATPEPGTLSLLGLGLLGLTPILRARKK